MKTAKHKEAEMRHQEWNISYDVMCPDKLTALNKHQRKAIASHIDYLRKRLAEAEFLLSCHENKWPAPEEINDNYLPYPVWG